MNPSEELWKEAESVILNGTQLYSKMASVGVNGVSPKFFVKAEGIRAVDLEGRTYVDYTMGLGPCFVGYNHPKVKQAIQNQLEYGTVFSLPNPLEVQAAKVMVDSIPCAELVRFLKTGSEATQAAVRVARAFTGRDIVLKGHYHGWHEWCLADTKKNGGIPEVYGDLVHEIVYNDIEMVEQLFESYPEGIACVIIEPFELEEPKDNYLERLREITWEHGALLVFDEVVTGFRFRLGGAQEYFGVTPDLAVFGKGMGGGLPLSALVGKRGILEAVKDTIFVSTTFGGDCLSLAAFLAVVEILKEPGVYDHVFEIGSQLKDGFNCLAKQYGSRIECIGLGPRLGFKYLNKDGEEDVLVKTLFMQEVVKRGVFFVWNMLPSLQTTGEDVAYTLDVFDEALQVVSHAEKQGNVKEALEGSPPITVI